MTDKNRGDSNRGFAKVILISASLAVFSFLAFFVSGNASPTRWILEGILILFLLLGYEVARWITVLLYGIAACISVYGNLQQNSAFLAAIGVYLVFVCFWLIKSQDINAFFAEKRKERRLVNRKSDDEFFESPFQ